MLENHLLAICEGTENTAVTCTEARIREIDRTGCYVNTPNTFPESTPLAVIIFHDDEASLIKGKIVYVHDRIGMAIAFDDLTGDERSSGVSVPRGGQGRPEDHIDQAAIPGAADPAQENVTARNGIEG